jgi:serine/threonine protein kinase
MSPRQLVDGQQ